MTNSEIVGLNGCWARYRRHYLWTFSVAVGSITVGFGVVAYFGSTAALMIALFLLVGAIAVGAQLFVGLYRFMKGALLVSPPSPWVVEIEPNSLSVKAEGKTLTAVLSDVEKVTLLHRGKGYGLESPVHITLRGRPTALILGLEAHGMRQLLAWARDNERLHGSSLGVGVSTGTQK